MPFNYLRAQKIATNLITKFGMPAVLRRVSGGDRPCIVAFVEYTPGENFGKLINPVNRLVLVSAQGLTLPPNQELDSLVTYYQPLADPPVQYEVLKILRPPGKFAPAGIVVYWELEVNR